jgi:hypothetical protein
MLRARRDGRMDVPSAMRWTLMGSSRRKTSILAFSASRLRAHSSSLAAFSAAPDLATAALSESVAVLAAIARIPWRWSSPAPPPPRTTSSLLTAYEDPIAAEDPELLSLVARCSMHDR